MMTMQDIHAAVQAALDKAKQQKNLGELAELQQIAGYLMRPAHALGDSQTERSFQILAAKAANIHEALLKGEDDD